MIGFVFHTDLKTQLIRLGSVRNRMQRKSSPSGANILAVRRGDHMHTEISANSRLEAGDTVIALGTRDQLQTLRQLAD